MAVVDGHGRPVDGRPVDGTPVDDNGRPVDPMQVKAFAELHCE